MRQLVALLCGVLVWQPMCLRAAQDGVRTARTSEMNLRRMAGDAPKPEYPAASLKAKTSGVAVGTVTVEPDGRPIVDMLEAPDEHIAAAVKSAVARWIFKPLALEGKALRTQAKLTFYFRIERGQGKVLNPDEMPGGPANKPPLAAVPGAKPAPSAQGPAIVTPHDVNVAPITFDELSKFTGAARPMILDIGDRAAFKRGHQPGAVNIPMDELIVRASIELREQKFGVIDCTQEDVGRCKMAAHYLESAGVPKFALLQR
jgi:rhodanese-related sulfurtransferase